MSQLKLALEIRFTKSYSRLLEDARLWLEGQKSMAIVAKLEEDPSFRYPLINLPIAERQKYCEETSFMIEPGNVIIQGEKGPAIYNGLLWVGEIKAAFVEIWKLDRVTDLAVRHTGRLVCSQLSTTEFTTNLINLGPILRSIA